MASQLSFEDLFEDLHRFIPDPIERWKECVKVKRGLEDTSQFGGMYKDQVYLKGAVEILINRNNINFATLYCGKISLKDYYFLEQKGLIKTEGLRLPSFLEN